MCFIQCTYNTKEQNQLLVNDPEIQVLDDENRNKLKIIEVTNDSIVEQNELSQSAEISLIKEKRYVPNIKTCLYIRTSPTISNSNIIQCLIPEKSSEFITEMYHELIPTGIIDGNWAEFNYSFDVNTQKPDPQDDVVLSKWLDNRDKAHRKAKIQYRAFRKKGWVKFKNNIGDWNIKIKRDGC